MSLNADHSRPRIAVVGAGWAGLAAAFTLKRAGWHTEVFEQSPVLGGRARKAVIARRGLVLDNGQHLMLGAYRHILELMQEIGVDNDHALLRLPLQLTSLDGALHLSVNTAHPGPLRLPLALLRMKGLSAGHKYVLFRTLLKLQLTGWHVAPDTAVLAWLQKQRQPTALIRLFWEPLCIATLNTPIGDASMALFAVVLRDSLAAGADASDLILPRVDLSALWPEVLAPQLTIHANMPVHGLSAAPGGYRLHTGTGSWPPRQPRQAPDNRAAGHDHAEQGDAVFDAVILAAPARMCHRLLSRLMPNQADNLNGAPITDDHAQPDINDQRQAALAEKSALLDQLNAFQYHAIATLTVFLERAFPLPGCMYMLKENRQAGHDGQWLFNRSRFMHPDAAIGSVDTASANATTPGAANDRFSHAISIVISHADHLIGTGRDNIANAILSQVRDQLPTGVTLPQVLGFELIMEKRATFAATPGLARPDCVTPWPGLFLAGDWTNTGYPGVLEGAVMSGLAAAQAAQAY
ncbi:FAD-dependent oxidoreductase [Advenella sp. FME57]|nr:FAD-dependent oxidoreductase [Advenella sp. FME57]